MRRASITGTGQSQHWSSPVEASAPWLRWLEWALLSGIPLGLTLLMKPWLMLFWHAVITLWSIRLGWPWRAESLASSEGALFFPQGDGTLSPSALTLGLTCVGLIAVWTGTAFFSDRFHPLKVTLRGLCLIQGVACAFFLLTPASFPYTVTRHLNSLLDMGYSLMLAVGPMLALGWGILKQASVTKIAAPIGVLTYFAIMLPHKVLLHAWVLHQGSVLFMPLLFMCFSALMDLWIFIALYAWLASRLPRTSASANPGAVA